MGSFLDKLNSALADFVRPGRTLDLALETPGASPVELGQAVRLIFGSPQPGMRPVEPLEAAERLRLQLEGAALGLKDGLPTLLARFELRIAAELRGKPDAQRQAGLILPDEFDRQGRGPQGHVLVDPAGTPWADLVPPTGLYHSGGTWLVLGWPRGAVPRPLYRAEDAIRYTAQLEGQRRQEQAQHDAEEQRREDSYRQAWQNSPAGRIQALEAEIAQLKAAQPAA